MSLYKIVFFLLNILHIKYEAMELMYTLSQAVKKSISLFLEWFSEIVSNTRLLAVKKSIVFLFNMLLTRALILL